MPDGDRFTRRLRGKGWFRVYRLACSKESPSLISDKLMEACAAAIRDGIPVSLLQQAGKEVCFALQLEAQVREREPDSLGDSAYLNLSNKLDAFISSGNFDLVQALTDAVRTVFIEFRQSCATSTEKQVIDRLAAVFVEKVVQTRFLARVRDGIMENCQRSIPEQISWEQELRYNLIGPAKKMLAAVLRSTTKAKIRAPKRSTPRRETTLEMLNQGLTVLTAQ
jgi:hypothetical protein